LALVFSRSSRLIPGLRAMPAVTMKIPGAGGLLVAVGADHPAVEALDRRRLPLVEPLALRDPLHDVDQHDLAGELLLRQPLRGGGADVPGARLR
jgi:hypothetical protein